MANVCEAACERPARRRRGVSTYAAAILRPRTDTEPLMDLAAMIMRSQPLARCEKKLTTPVIQLCTSAPAWLGLEIIQTMIRISIAQPTTFPTKPSPPLNGETSVRSDNASLADVTVRRAYRDCYAEAGQHAGAAGGSPPDSGLLPQYHPSRVGECKR